MLSGCFTSSSDKTIFAKNELRYSVEDLKEDFNIFRISLEEMHPGLYTFICKDSLDFYFENTFSKLNHPMTKDEFFRLLTPLIVKLYDEHTSLDFSYNYDSIEKLMPIKIRWINHEPYIYKNLLGNPQAILGSKVLTINGRNVNEIYKELTLNYQNGTPDQSLEYDVYSLHFDYLYASFIDEPDSFRIEAINPITKIKYVFTSTAVLKTDTVHFIPLPKMAEYYCKKDTVYNFKYDLKNDYAIIKLSGLNTYELEKNDGDFSKKLEQDFSTLNRCKINNLIIDLRYCFGGNPLYGADLISHLYNKPFHIFDTITSSIGKMPTYYNYTDWKVEEWKKEIPFLKELKESLSSKNECSTFRDTLILPKIQFKGKVYVLINSDIHSAAAITAALIKYNTNSTFIGTPISGPYNSGNAIDMTTITLPNTKINLNIPLLHYSYAIPDNIQSNQKGLNPDILILPKMDDILNDKDLILDSTISIIKMKNYR